ncbi:MAG: endo alpha-1,4 polygalactosaminidase [Chloroflexi bacterium]|nr:endo alpha-1,4 polygalactosaminidase [Chloroflexota bacterium]MCH8817828.1 endo alpha-1,4 polygalactosaminidase [Chloroflexota bacterium]
MFTRNTPLSHWLVLAATPIVLALAVSCGGGGESDEARAAPVTAIPALATAPTTAIPASAATPLPEAPGTWVYWLSDVDLQAISTARPPVTVIDYSQDGGPEGEFSDTEIQQLRSALPDPGLVIAYMSIGEAEDYRYYWQDGWKPGDPDWLDSVNPNWEGNFKVRYWDPEWQSIVFGSEQAYLDRILAAGFDGVYLDIIDAYEFFIERGHETAQAEIVEFVTAIGEYARQQHPGFLVIPQNAPELALRSDYLAAVDGIGMEGVYFGYDEQDAPTMDSITTDLEYILGVWINAGKLVLTVDYATSPDKVRNAYKRAASRGFTPTVTDVDLAGLPSPAP